ncbi:hypothetical protein HanIR_Chr02g0082291 [Helianthus annuus]|nr:hypothetical protein HanIR_Chr02g0082291 [Helianthus annuus]
MVNEAVISSPKLVISSTQLRQFTLVKKKMWKLNSNKPLDLEMGIPSMHLRLTSSFRHSFYKRRVS